MELVFAAILDQVFVAADTAGFQGLRAELFVLVGNEMDAEGEVVNCRSLFAQVKDADLRVWDSTTEPGLGVRLVLAVPVTKRRISGLQFLSGVLPGELRLRLICMQIVNQCTITLNAPDCSLQKH